MNPSGMWGALVGAGLAAAGTRTRRESIRAAKLVGLPCGSTREQWKRKAGRKKMAQASKRKNRR